MLTIFQVLVFSSLSVGDFLVLGPYIRPAHKGKVGRRYPPWSFFIHVFGGLGALLFGMAAVIGFSVGWAQLATAMTVSQGLAVVLFAGAFALPLSRHTLGLKGFNLVGYVLYTLFWIYSGLHALGSPTLEAAYACFVLTHAYLTCRVLVFGLAWSWKQFTGQRLAPDINYSVATTIAAMIPLAVAWGTTGLILGLASTGCAAVLHALGFSTPWHVRGYKDGDDEQAAETEIGYDRRLAVVTGTIDLA